MILLNNTLVDHNILNWICINSDSDSVYWKTFHFFEGHMAGLGMRTNFSPYSYIRKVEGNGMLELIEGNINLTFVDY